MHRLVTTFKLIQSLSAGDTSTASMLTSSSSFIAVPLVVRSKRSLSPVPMKKWRPGKSPDWPCPSHRHAPPPHGHGSRLPIRRAPAHADSCRLHRRSPRHLPRWKDAALEETAGYPPLRNSPP